MDLFVLDKLIITFIKGLITNGYTQIATLIGLWATLEVIFPSKKKKAEK